MEVKKMNPESLIREIQKRAKELKGDAEGLYNLIEQLPVDEFEVLPYLSSLQDSVGSIENTLCGLESEVKSVFGLLKGTQEAINQQFEVENLQFELIQTRLDCIQEQEGEVRKYLATLAELPAVVRALKQSDKTMRREFGACYKNLERRLGDVLQLQRDMKYSLSSLHTKVDTVDDKVDTLNRKANVNIGLNSANLGCGLLTLGTMACVGLGLAAWLYCREPEVSAPEAYTTPSVVLEASPTTMPTLSPTIAVPTARATPTTAPQVLEQLILPKKAENAYWSACNIHGVPDGTIVMHDTHDNAYTNVRELMELGYTVFAQVTGPHGSKNLVVLDDLLRLGGGYSPALYDVAAWAVPPEGGRTNVVEHHGVRVPRCPREPGPRGEPPERDDNPTNPAPDRTPLR